MLSRSWGFGLAVPFTHAGLLASYNITDEVEMNLGVVNGWDSVLNRDSGPAGLARVGVETGEHFSFSLATALGAESERFRSVVDGIATLTFGGFSLTGVVDWGHDGAGGPEGLSSANWVAASLTPRYDFNDYFALAARGEVFFDMDGARTEVPQTLGHGALAVIITPFQTPYFPLTLRAEVRHDVSSEETFLSGETPVDSATTIGLGMVLHWDDLTHLGRSSP